MYANRHADWKRAIEAEARRRSFPNLLHWLRWFECMRRLDHHWRHNFGYHHDHYLRAPYAD